jgi:LacI family transcriptional regulator
VPEYDGHFVASDHHAGAAKMIEYLLSMGHRRIGCIYEHPENSSIKDRLRGVQTALLQHAIPHDPSLHLDIPIAQVNARSDEIIQWIRSRHITAIFCCESELAREVYTVLQRAAISVPEDVSLCSFDDHAFGDRDYRFLTAVIQKLEDLGHYAIDIILNALSGRSSGTTRMTLEPELAIRSSVARIERES